MPTDLAAFYLANGYRQGEWGTPDRYRRPHSRGKAIAVIKASRRSTTAGGEFPDVSLASRMPQIVPNPRH
jgi:hypothetical protein